MRAGNLIGVIIKRHNLGEADKIITLFSLEKGKISLKAASVRKITSRRAGSLELFNLVKLGFAKGRGNLDVITEVETLDSFTSWKKHLGRVNIAYQLCEIIDKLTPENEPHPEMFHLLSDSLVQIASLDDDWQSTLNFWILSMIRELGYWPNNKPFAGDIYQLVEEISNRHLHSPAILRRLQK